MEPFSSQRLMTIAEHLYRLLLFVYPVEFPASLPPRNDPDLSRLLLRGLAAAWTMGSTEILRPGALRSRYDSFY